MDYSAEAVLKGSIFFVATGVFATVSIAFLFYAQAHPFAALWSTSESLQSFAFLMAFGLLVFMNYWVGERDLLYPAFLYSVLWLAVLALYLFCPIEINQISAETELLLLACAVLFSLGSFLGWCIPVAQHHEATAPLSNSGRKLLMFSLLLVLPFFVHDIAALAGGFGPGFIARARLAMIALAVQGQSAYGSPITKAAPNVAVLASLAMVLDWKRSSHTIAVITTVLAATYAILTTGRPQILELIVGIGTIWLFRRQTAGFVKTVRLALAPIIILVLFVAAIPMITKTQADESQSNSALEFAGTLFVEYAVGNVPALDVFLRNPPDAGNTYTYYPAAVTASRLLGKTTKDLENWYVFVPFPMNTYTAYRPYFFDFGLTGPLIFALCIGAFHGFLYKKARLGSDLFLFLFAVYLSTMTMTIFDDLYAGVRLLHHFEVLFFCVLYFGILRDFSLAKWFGRRSLGEPGSLT
jgi:oligosaccharide repeat unit polymerase